MSGHENQVSTGLRTSNMLLVKAALVGANMVIWLVVVLKVVPNPLPCQQFQTFCVREGKGILVMVPRASSCIKQQGRICCQDQLGYQDMMNRNSLMSIARACLGLCNRLCKQVHSVPLSVCPYDAKSLSFRLRYEKTICKTSAWRLAHMLMSDTHKLCVPVTSFVYL